MGEQRGEACPFAGFQKKKLVARGETRAKLAQLGPDSLGRIIIIDD